jgi:formate hydrogenlyase transcriptional activator
MRDIEGSYRALAIITEVLSSERELMSLWHTIIQQLKKVLPCERAGVTLYQPQTDAFRFYAMESTVPAEVLHFDAVIPRSGSAAGWVYDQQLPHVRPSLQQTRVFLEDDYYAEEGLGRMINCPLLAGGRCIGTLNIGSIEPGTPPPEDVEFLQCVATLIAAAIKSHSPILEPTLSDPAADPSDPHPSGTMIGQAPAFQACVSQAQAVARTACTVLVTGETGTGKELMARAIHELSPRRGKPLIRVNCAALPGGLIESELFGHERGAFTGADQRRAGRFELAHGGTLFLDEVGELPLESQAKLLRVLEDGEVDRLGSTRPVSVDVRIIAATNKDLVAAVREGHFRADLYYRLNVFPIRLPSLRERRDDIPALARHLLRIAGAKTNRSGLSLDRESMERLLTHPWPGNIREMQNVIERAAILARSSVVSIDPSLLSQQAALPEDSASHHTERQQITRVLQAVHWRIYGPYGAAARLGMPPSTLRSKMKKLGLHRPFPSAA